MNATTSADRVDHTIGPAGRFELHLPAGSVELSGVEGDVARVVDRSGRALGERFRIEAGEGSLTLSIRDGSMVDAIFGLRDKGTADLRVELPRGASVTIETTSADLEATGLVGRTQVRTASGDLTFEGVAGRLDIGSVSGDVDLEGAGTLELRVRTVSGEVDLRAPAFSRLEISTTSGDIDIDGLLSGPGPFAIQTVSGDAEIVGRSGLTIDAKTVTGDLGTEMPHRAESRPGRKSLVVGRGETRLSFQSVSGDLEVTAPRVDLPVESVVAALTPEPPAAPPAPEPPAPASPPAAREASAARASSVEDARLAILRALERGEIGVEEAGERLARLEEA
jgi:hypothetical protein